MHEIPDNFTGYLDVENDTYAFSVTDHIVTLLPAYADPTDRSNALKRLEQHCVEDSEFLYGRSGIDNVAFLFRGKVNRGIFNLAPSAKFGTPLIMKATGNLYDYYQRLTDKWYKYHAITFFGGNINPIFNPQIAVVGATPEEIIREDGVKAIKLRAFDEYTRKEAIEIGGETATLTISVAESGDRSDATLKNAYNLGILNSFIRLTFTNSQIPEQIAGYYRIMHDLIAILTMQSNVSFDVKLSQANSNGGLYPSAVCKILEHYENYAQKSWNQVVPIVKVVDYLPQMLTKIAEHKADVLLSVLPDNNKNRGRISITNVQDVCAALDAAYEWDDNHATSKKEKNATIEELKGEIKKAIASFQDSHPELDTYHQTNISSSMEHFNFSLKEKILTLYAEHASSIEAIIKRRNLPQIDAESVTKFVKLRNGKAHGSTFEWGDSADIYAPLLALVYACFFRSCGVPDEVIKDVLTEHLF